MARETKLAPPIAHGGHGTARGCGGEQQPPPTPSKEQRTDDGELEHRRQLADDAGGRMPVASRMATERHIRKERNFPKLARNKQGGRSESQHPSCDERDHRCAHERLVSDDVEHSAGRGDLSERARAPPIGHVGRGRGKDDGEGRCRPLNDEWERRGERQAGERDQVGKETARAPPRAMGIAEVSHRVLDARDSYRIAGRSELVEERPQSNVNAVQLLDLLREQSALLLRLLELVLHSGNVACEQSFQEFYLVT
jgi:hypothetical protein